MKQCLRKLLNLHGECLRTVDQAISGLQCLVVSPSGGGEKPGGMLGVYQLVAKWLCGDGLRVTGCLLERAQPGSGGTGS
jgi:hypothetical protein